MKQFISVSAPGKLMLLGDHAVVYNRPCLVTAINLRLKVVAEIIEKPLLQLTAKEIGIDGYERPMEKIGQGEIVKEVKFVELAVKNFINKYQIKVGIRITTHPGFSSLYGLGSSAAVTVCVLKAIANICKINITPKELFDLSYKTVLDVQGSGSGFDIAAAIHGGLLYFFAGGEKIEALSCKDLSLIVGFSGTKADTVSMLNLVEEKKKNYQKAIEMIFDNIARIVDEARLAILEKNWGRLGTLMDYNQSYLEDLGVSTDKLNQMIDVSRQAGAYGAKLSGAGGGDCMIALVSAQKRKDVEEAIKNTGGEIVEAEIDNNGVTIDEET